MQEILPSGGLANFHSEVSKLANLGRYEDAYIVHAAEGETVVPMEVFDSNPGLKEMLFNQMREMGIVPERYIVGNQFNSINPITGQPEFFLKKIFKEAKKALKKVAPYAGLIAGAFGAGPYWSALAGGLGGYYGSEGDASAAMSGAAMGYGAGTAFGSADWATTGTPNYIYDEGFEGSLGRMGANLGFNSSDVQLSEKAIENSPEYEAYKMKYPGTEANPTTVKTFVADDNVSYTDLAKIGSTSASKMTGNDYLTTAAILTPIYYGLKAEEEGSPGTHPDEIIGKYPWTGAEFGTTQAINPITGEPISQQEALVADGGIINAYNNGGDVQNFANGAGPFGVYYPEDDTTYDATKDIDQSGVVDIEDDLDLFMGDDMAMNERADQEGVMQVAGLNEMLTVYDKVEQRVVTITRAEFARNPGRYDIAEKSMLQQEAGDKGQEVMSPFVSGVMGAGAGAAANEFFEGATRPVGIHPETEDEGYTYDFDNKKYHFDEPIQRRMSPESYQLYLDALERGDITQEQFDIFMGKGVEGLIPYEKEQGMADGGIAYLAKGSFPRKTGSIAGPGGPKDDRVPAMLSDGEFVMTAKAVRNAGGGSRRQGAKKMYQLMNRLEGTA